MPKCGQRAIYDGEGHVLAMRCREFHSVQTLQDFTRHHLGTEAVGVVALCKWPMIEGIVDAVLSIVRDGAVDALAVDERIIGTDPNDCVSRIPLEYFDEASQYVISRAALDVDTKTFALCGQPIIENFASRRNDDTIDQRACSYSCDHPLDQRFPPEESKHFLRKAL